ncbi:MAG TPA: alpha/beta hydrolase [Pseudolabrys sp.]|nr:alpha/beta hydrolase [Pseudolabrys sp.]
MVIAGLTRQSIEKQDPAHEAGFFNQHPPSSSRCFRISAADHAPSCCNGERSRIAKVDVASQYLSGAPQVIVHAERMVSMSRLQQLTPTGRTHAANNLHTFKAHPYLTGAGAAVGLLALSALINAQLARRAERANPPAGRFIEIDGTRLHYVERGKGKPLLLLHGSGTMIQDFESSGLIDLAAQNYRVIAFDRPGYGHSERPRITVWTPEAQADLLRNALNQLGVPRAIVLGHSWGASVAVALALKYPALVSGLVLASGYYYPSARADVVALSAPAIPVIGDIVRYAISPIVSRLMWPLMLRKLFGPASVPRKFGSFPKEMTFRPSQIRASAAEFALMIPDAYAGRAHYKDLKMPVVIIAGDEDRLIDVDDQSAQLHRDIPQSVFHRIPGAGHMIHQTATEDVMAAIDVAAGAQTEDNSGPRHASSPRTSRTSAAQRTAGAG